MCIRDSGNCVQITEQTERSEEIIITACGQVETENMLGVFGSHDNLLPIALYRRVTNYCEVGPTLKRMVSCVELKSDKLEFLHYLSSYVAKSVVYKIGTTDAATTAEESASLGTGVCQDHVHIFLSCVRELGFPGRYVSGYLMLDDTKIQEASHAWAEVYIEHLGWVGFDISNSISPDNRYVKLAVGFDYSDVIPISGIRVGDSDEKINTKIIIETKKELINLIKSKNLIDVRTPSFLNTKLLIRKDKNLVELKERLKQIDLIDNIFIH